MTSATAERSDTRPLIGALELGGSKALCAVGSASHVVAEARIPTTSPAETLAQVVAFFEAHRPRLTALGVASFGPLELSPAAAQFGALLRTPKPGWSDVPLTGLLARALQVPVRIDTDVNAAALAEEQRGAGQGADPCVYITVGTGIGVGVRIAGRPLHGLLHPELGHLVAPSLCDFEGACPFHGRCLEGVASAHALRARTGKSPAELSDDDPLWELEARYLGHLLSACVLAYAPRRIVLGGGVLARAGLLAQVRTQLVRELAGYLPRHELTQAGVQDYVRAPHFGERAGLVGAFLLGEAAIREQTGL
ncbi:MAG: fructokinase [Myxococcaceae bacterium]|nr:fructokinase [Myxococcaceae bacterium]